MLLDLLGGREGTGTGRLARPTLRTLDRDVRLQGVRGSGPGSPRSGGTAGGAASAGRAKCDASALPRRKPIRVDVLGDGLSSRGLAPLSEEGQSWEGKSRRGPPGRSGASFKR